MTTQLTHEGTQTPTARPVTPADGGRVREAFHRLHLTVQEMNYASRRMTELQAPWSVDKQWHRN